MREDDSILQIVRDMHRTWAQAPVFPSWEVRQEEVARLADVGLRPAHALVPGDVAVVAEQCRARVAGIYED